VVSGMQHLIAVTGGIGTGKSKVCRFWASCASLPLVDVDQVCAELLGKGNKGWQAIRDEYGGTFFLQDCRIDRKKLRTAIFSDATVRLKVNSLIHPLAFDRIFEMISRCESDTVIIDVPLLFEASWENHFDSLVVVFADPEICCRRIVSRDGIDPAEAGKTILSQMPLLEKIMLADHVINNSGCWTATILEIVHLAKLISSEKKEGRIRAENS